jgi:galactose mutarotase-like enzyme
LGDHGLLWNRPWEVELNEAELTTRVAVQWVPLTFTRTIRLAEPNSLLLEYTIDNRASAPFEYLYAAHLMLHSDSTTRIVYPPEMTRAYVTVVIDNPMLHERTWIDWPPHERTFGREPLLAERSTLAKLFSPELKLGNAGVAHGDLDEHLTIEFSTDQLPYLGVLLAPGFGPSGKDHQSNLLAIEPTCSMADDLPMASENCTSRRIPAGQAIRFWLRLSLAEQCR